MKTITWKPGTNSDLDQLFDSLREKRYQDKSHRLWNNYHKDSFREVLALTICFDDHDVPEMCSSILARDCWPKGAYRILNRLWKSSNKIAYPRVMSPSFGQSTQSQIEWLKDNTDYQLYFLSRQTDDWRNFTKQEFSRQFDINWNMDNFKYLTCSNEQDESCWQPILYIGDKNLLLNWKRK